ncbi:MAG: D-alanyl-D-alanine carboxypeptidase [Spirochaetes bacterium]|nr:D-alanyl-D-alanine carboxypeptidase [Spirochaetota bacterium]MBU0953938.1 D-alanyl-D-alanine carboxypeptidase [Spirochaetota bacterium]
MTSSGRIGHKLITLLFLALLLGGFSPLLFAGAESLAAASREVPANLDAEAVVIMDFARGEILYEKNADKIIPPASLTKLMTLHVMYEALDRGELSRDTRIPILWEDVTLPYDSSLMYLQAGMSVPVIDLMLGLAVISGNDAARAVSRYMSGSTEAFAALMNAEAQKMGLVATRFEEPSGLSEYNTTTAREMALFSRYYLQKHPEALAEVHNVYSMEFPRADVMPPGMAAPAQKILLRNRNQLIFSYDGCDGLKTGYITESGFNIVVTAERGATRFIVVSMGGRNGVDARARTASNLLDWAFERWETVSIKPPQLPELRVWDSAEKYLEPVLAEELTYTIERQQASQLKTRAVFEEDLRAPIAAGTKLGTLIISAGDQAVRRVDIVAPTTIERGNIFIRIRDAIQRWWSRVFGK